MDNNTQVKSDHMDAVGLHFIWLQCEPLELTVNISYWSIEKGRQSLAYQHARSVLHILWSFHWRLFVCWAVKSQLDSIG